MSATPTRRFWIRETYRIVFTMPSFIFARIFSPIELQGDQHEEKRDFLEIAKLDLTRFENERFTYCRTSRQALCLTLGAREPHTLHRMPQVRRTLQHKIQVTNGLIARRDRCPREKFCPLTSEAERSELLSTPTVNPS